MCVCVCVNEEHVHQDSSGTVHTFAATSTPKCMGNLELLSACTYTKRLNRLDPSTPLSIEIGTSIKKYSWYGPPGKIKPSLPMNTKSKTILIALCTHTYIYIYIYIYICVCVHVYTYLPCSSLPHQQIHHYH